MPWMMILFGGLSLSIGWGIRGQFGHEYGASMAGAMGGLAIALVSGRADWRRRAPWIGLLAGVGFGFGGSMSYMKVVAYSHSADSATVLYGYANLFVLGFLWALPGGALAALAVELDSHRLRQLLLPLLACCIGWCALDVVVDLARTEPAIRSVLGPIRDAGVDLNVVAVIPPLLLLPILTRRWRFGTGLALSMAVGYQGMYWLLRGLAGLRMTPPRGDEWAGLLGIAVAILLWSARARLLSVALGGVLTGIVGGLGFAFCQQIKLFCVASGYQSNWHSVLEQSQGLMHGVALACTLIVLRSRSLRQSDGPRWNAADAIAVGFTFFVFTYINLRKAPAHWMERIPGIKDRMFGLAPSGWLVPSMGWIGWIEILYLAGIVTYIVLYLIHRRSRLAFVPETDLGKGQLLYLGFLWSMVVINFVDVLPRFDTQRLVTEWVIALNAILCTLLMGVGGVAQREPVLTDVAPRWQWPLVRRIAMGGMALAVLACFAEWRTTRALFGDTFAPHAGEHVRFGPKNTNDKR